MSGGMQQGKTRHVVTLVMGSHLWDRGAPLNGEVRSQAKIGEAVCGSTHKLTNGWALKAGDMK